MQASICKYFASEMCGRVADRCVQMFGGYGYIADFGIERFYRDVRLFRLYEGTSQIHQLNIARRTLAQPRAEPRRRPPPCSSSSSPPPRCCWRCCARRRPRRRRPPPPIRTA